MSSTPYNEGEDEIQPAADVALQPTAVVKNVPHVLVNCQEPGCKIRFINWAHHEFCSQHTDCLTSEGRYDPAECDVCFPIICSLRDPRNFEKHAMAQPILAWTKQLNRSYRKRNRKKASDNVAPFFVSPNVQELIQQFNKRSMTEDMARFLEADDLGRVFKPKDSSLRHHDPKKAILGEPLASQSKRRLSNVPTPKEKVTSKPVYKEAPILRERSNIHLAGTSREDPPIEVNVEEERWDTPSESGLSQYGLALRTHIETTQGGARGVSQEVNLHASSSVVTVPRSGCTDNQRGDESTGIGNDPGDVGLTLPLGLTGDEDEDVPLSDDSQADLEGGSSPLARIQNGTWIKIPADSVPKTEDRGGSQRYWFELKLRNGDVLTEKLYDFNQDRNDYWFYRPKAFADEPSERPIERFESLSQKYRKAFATISRGVDATGLGRQGVNEHAGPRKTVNQWIRFSRDNPWLKPTSLYSVEVWKEYIRTHKLPNASDSPFLRVFLELGGKDYHACLSAPVISQTDLTKRVNQLKISDPKLADQDLQARTALVELLELVSGMYFTADSFIDYVGKVVENPQAVARLGLFRETWKALSELPVFTIRRAVSSFFAARENLRADVLKPLKEGLGKDSLMGADPFCPGLFPEDVWTKLTEAAATIRRTLSEDLPLKPKPHQGKKRPASNQGGRGSKRGNWGGRGRGGHAFSGGNTQSQTSDQGHFSRQGAQQVSQPFRGKKKRGRGKPRGKGKGRGSNPNSNQPRSDQ